MSNLINKQGKTSRSIGTSFADIFAIFLNSISNDYRLKQMFEKNADIANEMLISWLIKAIAYFSDCSQDLENNFDVEQEGFYLELTLTEKIILSDLMLLAWMDWNINNILQMNLSLQDNDFNRHAETQNLRGKIAQANEWRERVYHQISEYTHKNLPIADWATGGNL